jgi:hypothetical protein
MFQKGKPKKSYMYSYKWASLGRSERIADTGPHNRHCNCICACVCVSICGFVSVPSRFIEITDPCSPLAWPRLSCRHSSSSPAWPILCDENDPLLRASRRLAHLVPIRKKKSSKARCASPRRHWRSISWIAHTTSLRRLLTL